MDRTEIAIRANQAAEASSSGGAPLLSGQSAREDVLAWLQWNDSNGVYLDDLAAAEDIDPMTDDEAWETLADVIADVWRSAAKSDAPCPACGSADATTWWEGVRVVCNTCGHEWKP